MAPPMPKAETLAEVRLMPALWAASSSSPTARHRVPTRERSSHHSSSITPPTSAQISRPTSSVDQPLLGK